MKKKVSVRRKSLADSIKDDVRLAFNKTVRLAKIETEISDSNPDNEYQKVWTALKPLLIGSESPLDVKAVYESLLPFKDSLAKIRRTRLSQKTVIKTVGAFLSMYGLKLSCKKSGGHRVYWVNREDYEVLLGIGMRLMKKSESPSVGIVQS